MANGGLLKSSYYADTIKSSPYSSAEKDYEEHHHQSQLQQQRVVHQSSCDTSDYGGSGVELGKSPPTSGAPNTNYYSSSPNLNGMMLGNIHVVRAKTEDLASFDGHQMPLKPSALASLGSAQNILLIGGNGGSGGGGGANEDLSMHTSDSNNNHSEPFLSLIPPPPHVAAELGRRCLTFNNEQVRGGGGGGIN